MFQLLGARGEANLLIAKLLNLWIAIGDVHGCALLWWPAKVGVPCGSHRPTQRSSNKVFRILRPNDAAGRIPRFLHYGL